MQLQLGLIPEYKNSRLYNDLVEIKPHFFSGAAYDGPKILVFYNAENASEHTINNEISRIHFPNFKLAYEFIISNKIKNFNFENGCYKTEINKYNKESKKCKQ